MEISFRAWLEAADGGTFGFKFQDLGLNKLVLKSLNLGLPHFVFAKPRYRFSLLIVAASTSFPLNEFELAGVVIWNA